MTNKMLGCMSLLNIKLFFFSLLNSIFFFLSSCLNFTLTLLGGIFTKIESLTVILWLSCMLAVMKNTWKCWFQIEFQ